MSTVLSKVRSRGSWTVRIRPVDYQADRVEKLSNLMEAVKTSHVELRGWDFPHFDYKTSPQRFTDYIEQYCDWAHYVELWRAYKSGQFISISALWGDWRDQSDLWSPHSEWKSGATLGVEDMIFRFVEIFEFAARWANAISMGEEMSVECTLCGLRNRSLELSPKRMGCRFSYVSSEDEFTWEKQYSTAVLFSAPRENAIAPATSLLELFGWDTNDDFVRDIQSELRA